MRGREGKVKGGREGEGRRGGREKRRGGRERRRGGRERRRGGRERRREGGEGGKVRGRGVGVKGEERWGGGKMRIKRRWYELRVEEQG